MNSVKLEDTVFILNMRIRMIKDTLRLSPPPELFLEKSLDDLVFVDSVLEALARRMAAEKGAQSGNSEFECVSDAEWQFNQLLTEFALESSPFPVNAFPEVRNRIAVLRGNSNARRKSLEETNSSVELVRAEPVVTSAEMSSLLGGS